MDFGVTFTMFRKPIGVSAEFAVDSVDEGAVEVAVGFDDFHDVGLQPFWPLGLALQHKTSGSLMTFGAWSVEHLTQ